MNADKIINDNEKLFRERAIAMTKDIVANYEKREDDDDDEEPDWTSNEDFHFWNVAADLQFAYTDLAGFVSYEWNYGKDRYEEHLQEAMELLRSEECLSKVKYILNKDETDDPQFTQNELSIIFWLVRLCYYLYNKFTISVISDDEYDRLQEIALEHIDDWRKQGPWYSFNSIHDQGPRAKFYTNNFDMFDAGNYNKYMSEYALYGVYGVGNRYLSEAYMIGDAMTVDVYKKVDSVTLSVYTNSKKKDIKYKELTDTDKMNLLISRPRGSKYFSKYTKELFNGKSK